MPGYGAKVAENRASVVASVGLGMTILLTALAGLGLPRPVWAIAAGIGTAMVVYALLVEGPPEDTSQGLTSAQFNDGGSGDGDRFFINQLNLGVREPKEAPSSDPGSPDS